jgi:hypothetical protein
MTEDNKIRDAADAVKGILQAVPVDQDVVQPTAKEVGAALQTVVRTIHIALAPVSALVWGYDLIREFVLNRVAEKLKDVPIEDISIPRPNVAGPALEALKYTGHEETLREMYANLLAASMDKRTASGAHPAFVEIIRQLTPDEARIIKLFTQDRPFPLLSVMGMHKVQTHTQVGGYEMLTNFSLVGYEAGCEFPHLTPAYLDNLCRLGLAEIPEMWVYTAPGLYDALENHPYVVAAKQSVETHEGLVPEIQRKGLRVTELGRQFCRICVVPHEEKDLPSGH